MTKDEILIRESELAATVLKALRRDGLSKQESEDWLPDLLVCHSMIVRIVDAEREDTAICA